MPVYNPAKSGDRGTHPAFAGVLEKREEVFFSFSVFSCLQNLEHLLQATALYILFALGRKGFLQAFLLLSLLLFRLTL